MNKSVRIIVLVLLVLVLITYVAARFFLGSIVKGAVNQAGPRLTQSKVELADASISPFSGSGTLTGLSVGNPKGWSDARAIYLGKVSFDVSPGSLLSDPILVNDFTVDQPEIVYETRVVSSNVGDLLKNIEAAVGSKSETHVQATKQRKFIVKHFRFQNAKVSLGVGPTALQLNLPVVELKDLGVAEGGLTSSQLAVAAMKAITPEIIGAAAKSAGGMGGVLKKATDLLQKIQGGKKTDTPPAEPPKQ